MREGQAVVKAKGDLVVKGLEDAWLFPAQEDKAVKRDKKNGRRDECSCSGVETKQGIPVLCKPVIFPFIASLLRGRQLFSMVAF